MLILANQVSAWAGGWVLSAVRVPALGLTLTHVQWTIAFLVLATYVFTCCWNSPSR